ncbi:MAG: DUF4290 domain-containing protein [Cytophagales bacterium]
MFTEEYNTQRSQVILKEYGRNVQIMANHLLSITDREKRSQQAKIVVEMMKQLIPFQNNQDTYQKLWDDLHLMCHLDLDVDCPFPVPQKELLGKKPKPMSYNTQSPKIKHYGKSIELLIQELIKIENEEEREMAAISVAKIMKNFYVTWNKDLTDDIVVLNDLEKLSGYALKLDKEKILSEGHLNLGRDRRKQNFYSNNNNGGGFSKNNGGGFNKNRRFNNNNNNNRRRK